jgi:atypical dual specificity phosphatase
MRPRHLAQFALAAAPSLVAACGVDDGEHPKTCADEPAQVIDEQGDTVVEEQAPLVMHGFSFVDAQLAGMPQPGAWRPLANDLAFLKAQEIDLLVSLTMNPTSPDALEHAGLTHAHIPIVDMTPPTLDQQLEFVALLESAFAEGLRVGVHCLAGQGRTGTMLATWFVKTGMTATEAIAHVRSLRPGSIETVPQENAIHAYELHLSTTND